MNEVEHINQTHGNCMQRVHNAVGVVRGGVSQYYSTSLLLNVCGYLLAQLRCWTAKQASKLLKNHSSTALGGKQQQQT
jgi:hypothetical protein